MNLRLATPELRRQRASNLQMIQLKLDEPHLFGKIATDVARAHQQASDFAALDLCFDYHGSPRNRMGCDQSVCQIDRRSYDVRKRTLHLSEMPDALFVRYGEPNPR